MQNTASLFFIVSKAFALSMLVGVLGKRPLGNLAQLLGALGIGFSPPKGPGGTEKTNNDSKWATKI